MTPFALAPTLAAMSDFSFRPTPVVVTFDEQVAQAAIDEAFAGRLLAHPAVDEFVDPRETGNPSWNRGRPD